MKIAIVNTFANSGGAALAAKRLHEGLRRSDQESVMYVRDGCGEGVTNYVMPVSAYARVKRMIRSICIRRRFSSYAITRPQGLEIFSSEKSIYGADVLSNLQSYDVVNLHWVVGFIDYASLSLLHERPVVWTLHDMNPFTGGCHYNNGCDRYLFGCGACPQLGSNQTDDLSYHIWWRKKKAFNLIDPNLFHVVAPSRWLATEVKRSALMKRFSVSIIPNGLDTDFFAPRKTDGLKQAFGISQSDHVILFLADSVDNKRKGMEYLLDAIDDIQDRNRIVLMTVGSGINSMHYPFRHIRVGRIEDERLLSMIYSLADVFVIPSLEDNLPNTVLEAMACGTPVVGFDIGGLSDMVRNGETGVLVPANNVAEMKTAIEYILGNDMLRESMSRCCRSVAVSEYDVNIQAKRYTELYELLRKKGCNEI